jgi:hypothetical protein
VREQVSTFLEAEENLLDFLVFEAVYSGMRLEVLSPQHEAAAVWYYET